MLLLEGHKGNINDNALAFSPDGRLLVSGGTDKQVRLWDLAGRRPLHLLKGHKDHVTGVGFLRGGSVAVSCGWDRCIYFWDTEAGTKLATTKQDNKYNMLGVSHDGQTAAAAGGDAFTTSESVDLYDATSFKKRGTIGQHDDQIGAIVFSRDGKWLATGSADNTARVWDLATGEQLTLVRRRAWIQGLAISPDCTTLAVATGRAVTLHRLPGGEKLHSLDRHNDTVFAIAFTPSGQHLLSTGDDELVNLWEVSTGRLLRAFRWKLGSIHSLVVAPDGMTAAAAGGNKICVWDLEV